MSIGQSSDFHTTGQTVLQKVFVFPAPSYDCGVPLLALDNAMWEKGHTLIIPYTKTKHRFMATQKVMTATEITTS